MQHAFTTAELISPHPSAVAAARATFATSPRISPLSFAISGLNARSFNSAAVAIAQAHSHGSSRTIKSRTVASGSRT